MILDFNAAIEEDSTADELFADQVRRMKRSAPRISQNPAALVTLAQQGDLRAGVAAEAKLEAKASAERFKAFPPEHQLLRWTKLTAAEQTKLRQGGYDPPLPKPRKPQQAGIGGILADAAKWTAKVTDVPPAILGKGLSVALKVVDSPSQLLKHTYRMTRYRADEGLFGSGDADAALLDPRVQRVRPLSNRGLDAWRATELGDRNFRPKAILAALDALGTDDPDTYGLTVRLAAGDTIDEIAEDYAQVGTPEYEEQFAELVRFAQDPGVMAATKALGKNSAKVTFGGTLALNWGVTPDSRNFNLLSGALDASVLVLGDPLNTAGSALKAGRATYYGLDGLSQSGKVAKIAKLIPDDVDEVAKARTITDPSDPQYLVQLAGTKLNATSRMAVVIADHMNVLDDGARDFASLGSIEPRMKRFLATLKDYDDGLREAGERGITSAADVRDFYTKVDTLVGLAAGEVTTHFTDALVLPRLTRMGAVAKAPKRTVENAINYLVDADFLVAKAFSPDELEAAGLGLANGRLVTKEALATGNAKAIKAGEVGTREALSKVSDESLEAAGVTRRALKAATIPGARIPLSAGAAFVFSAANLVPKSRWLDLDGPEVPEVLDQVLGFGLRGQERRNFFNEFLNTSRDNGRRDVASQFYRTIFERVGILDDPATKEFAERFINYTNQSYGIDDTDLVRSVLGDRRVGLLPDAHHANGLAVPDFREFIAQYRRGKHQELLYNSANNRWADAFIGRVWKPSVLLRIGFIPRAAGEELLATIMRLGPRRVYNGWATQTALGPIKSGRTRDAFRPDGRRIIGYDQSKLLPGFDLAAHAATRLTSVVAPAKLRAMRAADPKRLVGEVALRNYSAAVRRGVAASIGVDAPYLFRAAAMLSEDSAYTDAIMDGIGGVNLAERIDTPDLSSKKIRSIAGVDYQPKGGAFTTSGQRDPTFMWHLDGRYAEFNQDRVHRLLANIATAHVVPEQAARVAGHFGGGGYEKLAAVQDAFSSAPPGVRQALFSHLDAMDKRAWYVAGEEVTPLQYAGSELARRPKFAKSPEGKLVTDLMARLNDDAVPMADKQLMVHDARRALTSLDERRELVSEVIELPGGPGATKLTDDSRWVIQNAVAEADPSLADDLGDAIRSIGDSGLPDGFSGLDDVLGEAMSPDEFHLYELRAEAWIARDEIADTLEAKYMEQLRKVFGAPDTMPDSMVLDQAAAVLDDDDILTALAGRSVSQETEQAVRRLNQLPEVADRLRALDGATVSIPYETFDDAGELTTALRIEALKPEYRPRVVEGKRIVNRRNELLTRVRAGDENALRTLMEESAVARMQQADMTRNVQGMDLAGQNDGVTVASGVAKGRQRVYFVADPATGRATGDWATSDWRVAEGRATQFGGELSYVDIRESDFAAAQRRAFQILPEDEVGPGVVSLMERHTARATVLGDTRAVVDGVLTDGITQEEALRGFAQRQVENALGMFKGRQSGETLTQLTRPISARRYNQTLLDDADLGELQPYLTGPEYEQVPDVKLSEQIINGGFAYIGRSIHSLVRRPQYLNAMAKGLKFADELTPLLRSDELTNAATSLLGKLNNDEILEAAKLASRRNGRLAAAAEDEGRNAALQGLDKRTRTAWGELEANQRRLLMSYVDQEATIAETTRKIATQRALADVTPLIDDHRVRSQMDMYVRNVVPFMFAEVQFLKRWARVFSHSPEALRKAQLMYQGLQHGGWVEQNEFGEDVFVYPFAEHMVDLVGRFVPGGAQLPVKMSLTGQTKFAAPGAENPGKPGFSPIIGLPLNLITRMFPELHDTTETLLGPRGTDRSIPDMLIPASAMRFYKAYKADDDDAQFASATMSALQVMQAADDARENAAITAGNVDENGIAIYERLVPAQNADADERDQYLQRVKNWARVVYFTRAAIGFSGPTSATLDLPDSLSDEFKEKLQLGTQAGQTFEEVTLNFLMEYPNATAYTVFASDIPSGAPLPATASTLDYMQRNGGFLQQLPDAAPWFLPADDRTEPYERRARAEQFKLGLRDNVSSKEYLRSLAFQEGAELYFPSAEAHKRFMAETTSPTARAEEMASWRTWKEQYFAQYPIFAEELQSTEGRARRTRVLDQMDAALAAPEAQEAKHYEALRTLVASHKEHEAFMARTVGDRSAGNQRRRREEKQSYADWAAAYANANPRVKAFYDRIIRPEIGADPTEDTDG